MDEPLVFEAVEEELKSSGKGPTFTEYMDQLTRLIENLGASSATKGEALEMLVRRSLQRFNGVRLVDLPFHEGIFLPIGATISSFRSTTSKRPADLDT